MRVGDVVNITWYPERPNMWHDAVGIVVEVHKTCVSVKLLVSPQVGLCDVRGAFDIEHLELLGHIDLEEGEKRCAEET